jgi:YVTN family beta-propeller protein
MTKLKTWILLSLALALLACEKDVPPTPELPVITGGVGGVYITNEGNFQFGNAAVSYYEEGMEDAIPDLFEPANGYSLGDVCQSMYIFNGKAYLVVNNSGKIEVVNESTFEVISTITGFNSPRYFLPVSNNKAYVTDLYANAISVVDLSTNTKTGQISCNGWTENMALAYGEVFITNRERNFLYVVNSQNDVLTDSIAIGFGANSIVEDFNGKLWVLCSGSNGNNISATLHRINPLNHTVEATHTFPEISDSPWRLSINGTNDTLYFLNNGVFSMPVESSGLPPEPLIAADGRVFYGLGIQPSTGHIFVADAIDYVQRGKIYIYKTDGSEIQSFLAGIIPGDFYFK